MPCEKCEDGKVKWGSTGKCEYDSIAECEADNKDYYKKNTMRPTPLGKKSYEEYEKELKEFKLSTQKIDLSVKDDAQDAISNTADIIGNAVGIVRDSTTEANDMLKYIRTQEGKFDKYLSQLKQFSKDLDKKQSELLKIENEFDQLGKDLGINVNDIPAYKGISDMYNEAIGMQEEIEEAIDKMNDVLVI